jgi:hypothetical protein
LLSESGPALFPFYGHRLLHRGWAGTLSDPERRYLRSHAGWYRAQEIRGHALQEAGFTLPAHGESPRGVVEPTGGAPGVVGKVASARRPPRHALPQ